MSAGASVKPLKSLKLFGMAGAIGELAAQRAPAFIQSSGLLECLINERSSVIITTNLGFSEWAQVQSMDHCKGLPHVINSAAPLDGAGRGKSITNMDRTPEWAESKQTCVPSRFQRG